jgi:sulfate permease, SulP family
MGASPPSDLELPAAALADTKDPGRFMAAVRSGVVIGVVEVVGATSFAVLIFPGNLSGHVPAGIGLALFTAMVTMVAVALLSTLPGTLGSTQDTTAVILALIAGSIAGKMGAADPRTFFTIVLALGLASAMTGAVFFILGFFRLGDFIRFVPHPVIGGFLAGTGWLLFKGGMGVLAGRELSLSGLSDFARVALAQKWFPGLAFAVLLVFLSSRYEHPLEVPIALVAGIALFFGIMLASGQTIEQARAGGWLLPSLPQGQLFKLWSIEALGKADWGAIVSQAASLVTLIMVAVFSLLLTASGIELAMGEDVDLNRELRAAGAANVASGLGGGLVGFQALSLTALARRGGAATRLVGLVAAAVCLLTLLFGASLVSLFPQVVLGGLLVFLGLSFFVEWVYEAWFKLPRAEYAILILILVVIAALGLLQGVVVGVAVAVVLFVVNYSRTDVVKHSLTGASYKSNRDRPARDRESLRRQGDQLHILELQGFIFFGTANALVERIRQRLGDGSLAPLRFLVLDFRRVTGLDSSAVLSFAKVLKLAELGKFELVLTGLSDAVKSQLERGGLTTDGEGRVQVFRDLDRGLEWCEDRLLAGDLGPAEGTAPSIWSEFEEGLENPVDMSNLLASLERLDVPAGYFVIHQGATADDVFFLESGRLTATLSGDAGEIIRLRTMEPGTVVGELAFYTGGTRTASVVTESPSVLYRLSRQAFDEIEAREPQLAVTLHRRFATILAERLADNLATMAALLD